MVKIISYEQEIKIKNFIENFKSKGKIYGSINIIIADDFHSIDSKVYIDSDIDEAEQMGFENGQDDFEEKISVMSGIDLSEYVDEETAEELIEYYRSKREW